MARRAAHPPLRASPTGERLMCSAAVEGVDVPEQAEVQGEADDAGDRRRNDHAFLAAEERVHCGGEEPELQHDDHSDDRQNSADDRQLLLSRKTAPHARTSTPVAYKAPSRICSSMRGNGRRGGPAVGMPLARSK